MGKFGMFHKWEYIFKLSWEQICIYVYFVRTLIRLSLTKIEKVELKYNLKTHI